MGVFRASELFKEVFSFIKNKKYNKFFDKIFNFFIKNFLRKIINE